MGRPAHAARRARCFPVRVALLLLTLTLLLVAAMVAGLAGPLAAPARED